MMIIATSTPLAIYIALAWFLGIAGTIDVLLQPRRAFRDAGRSKLKWLGIELGGGILLLGPFTWAYYAVKIRRELLQHGGRKPRKLTNFWMRYWADVFDGASGGSSGGGGGSHKGGGGGSCGCINGKAICPKCKGSTKITDPNTGQMIQCNMCYGSRVMGVCPRCKGTGQLA